MLRLVAKTLKTFTIDLTQQPTMADLLKQVRGEEVEVLAPNAIKGSIIGVEKRKVRAGKEEVIEVDYLNLLTDGGLKSVAFETISSIKLTNPALDAELRQILKILATTHDNEKKTVTLNFLGKEKRDVRVGYIQETPVWKTSYRLVLGDEDKPLLQGWAIVENTTESDWKDVRLDLVSGRPISFQMDLYQPLYVNRPTVQPELFASLVPKVYDQDLASRGREFDRKAAAATPAPANRPGIAGGRYMARGAEKQELAAEALYAADAPSPVAMDAMKDRDGLANTVAVGAAESVGEMFQYHIDMPVSIARQQSAMIPIVNAPVEVEKLAIYNQATHAKFPLHGFRFKNTTDLHLMQGPVTVYEDGAYAGDARIQDLAPKSERLVSYAIDLNTEVSPGEGTHREELASALIRSGVLELRKVHRQSQTYTVKNSGEKARKVLIERPLMEGWTLKEPAEPAEKTRDLYRFAVDAEPGKPAELKVQFERTVTESVAVLGLDSNAIQFYLKAEKVGEPVKEFLREVARRKAKIAEFTAARAPLEQQVKTIGEEQARIRDNMQRLDRNSELYQRYVKKFGEQEDTIEKLGGEINTLKGNETKAQKELVEFVNNAKIEA